MHGICKSVFGVCFVRGVLLLLPGIGHADCSMANAGDVHGCMAGLLAAFSVYGVLQQYTPQAPAFLDGWQDVFLWGWFGVVCQPQNALHLAWSGALHPSAVTHCNVYRTHITEWSR